MYELSGWWNPITTEGYEFAQSDVRRLEFGIGEALYTDVSEDFQDKNIRLKRKGIGEEKKCRRRAPIKDSRKLTPLAGPLTLCWGSS